MTEVPGSIPHHVAIVMDGNGRWARERGLPRIRGHEEGANSVAEAAEACRDYGVEWLTLYAFSAENWRRPKSEVDALMTLLARFLDTKSPEMLDNGIRLRAIGEIDSLPQNCRRALASAVDLTAGNTRLNIVLALSYGSRQEIVAASRRIAAEVAAGKLALDEIDESCFADRLYTAGMPDPDLLIRTSGELRISNFLLWQLSYTEIHISSKLWPEFRKDDMAGALADFARRKRRFGGVESND